MPSPFEIHILDASGSRVGTGPLTTVTKLDDSKKLDGIGMASFTFPAVDPRASLITAGSQFDIFDEVDGYLGRYFFKERAIKSVKGKAEISITAYDSLIELVRSQVGFHRNYYFEPVDQVILDLLVSLAPSWHYNLESGIGNTSVTYEGGSIFAAIDVLRDRWSRHYRLNFNSQQIKTLEFGSFGANSGLLFTDLQGQTQYGFNIARKTALVTSIEENTDGDWIINRITPLGAGQGEAAITIQNAVGGSYTVQEGTNRDGSKYYYIEDAASIAANGLRPRETTFSGIRPLSNNQTDIQRAKNAIKLAAEAQLVRHLNPKTDYKVSIQALREEIKVGDKVRLAYRGTTDEGTYLDVNEDFYLLSITRKRNYRGNRSASVDISSVDDRRTSDQDMIVDLVQSVKALKMEIQPYPFRYEVQARDNVGGFGQGTFLNQKRAKCRVLIDKTMTDITKVVLRFRTAPLFTYTQVNFALADYWFSPVNSVNYPSDLRLYVNGIDVSANYGGPWNLGGLNQQLAVFDLDITTLLKNAIGGLYQEHLIEIVTLVDRVGEVMVPGAGTLINAEANTGEVFFTVVVQGTAQAIISI